MKKVAIVLVSVLVGLMAIVNPARAFMVHKDSHTIYRVVMNGSSFTAAAFVPFNYETDLLPGVVVTHLGRFDPKWGIPVGAIAITTDRLENYVQPTYRQPQYYGNAGGGYYQPQPYHHQYPQGYYQPQSPYPQYPQGGYYRPQQPTVVYQPAPQYGNPYGDFIEGIFVNAIGNVINSAGNGAADRVYDEIARGGRRYRGYYRGGHYRR